MLKVGKPARSQLYIKAPTTHLFLHCVSGVVQVNLNKIDLKVRNNMLQKFIQI